MVMDTGKPDAMKNLNEELKQKLEQFADAGTLRENKARTALLYAMYMWNQDQYVKSQDNTVSEPSLKEWEKVDSEKEKEIISSLVGTAYYYIKNRLGDVFKHIVIRENYDVMDEACESAQKILENHKETISYKEYRIDLDFGWDDINWEEGGNTKSVILFLLGYDKSSAWVKLMTKINQNKEKEFYSAIMLAEWIKFADYEYVKKICWGYFNKKLKELNIKKKKQSENKRTEEQDNKKAEEWSFAPNFVSNHCWIFEKRLAGKDYIQNFSDYTHSVNGFERVSEDVLERYISLTLSEGGEYEIMQYEIAIQVSDVATLVRLLGENGLGETQRENLAVTLKKNLESKKVSRILTDQNVAYAIALKTEDLKCVIYDAYIRSEAKLWRRIGEDVSRKKQKDFYALVCRLRIGNKDIRCKAVRVMDKFLSGFSEKTQAILRERLNKEMLLTNEIEDVKKEAEKTGITALLECANAWEKFKNNDAASLSEIVTIYEGILQNEEYEVINQCGMLLSKWLINDCDKLERNEEIKRTDVAYLSKERVYGYFFTHFMDPDGGDLLSKFYYAIKDNQMRDPVNLMEKIKFPDDSNVDEYAFTNVKRSLERTANNNVATNFLINNAYLIPLIQDVSYVSELIYQIKRNKGFQGETPRTVEKYFEYFCEVPEDDVSEAKKLFEEEMLIYIGDYVYEILRQTADKEAFREKSAMMMLEEMFRPGCRLERSLLLTEKVDGEDIYVHGSKLIFFVEKYYESGLNDCPESKLKALVGKIRRDSFYEKDRIAYDWQKKILEGYVGQGSEAFTAVSRLVFSFYPNCDTDKLCDAIDTNYLRRDNDISFWKLLELLSNVLSENIQLQKRIYRYVVNKVSLGSEANEEALTVLVNVLRCEKENLYTAGADLDKRRTEKGYCAARYLVAMSSEGTDMERFFDEMAEEIPTEADFIAALHTLHNESWDEFDIARVWKKNIVFGGITNYWDSCIEAFLAEDNAEVRGKIKEALEDYLKVINAAPFYRRVLQKLVYPIQALAEKKVGSIDKAGNKKKVVHIEVSANMKKDDEELIEKYKRMSLLCSLNPHLESIYRSESFYTDSNIHLELDYVLKNSYVDAFLNSSKRELTELSTSGGEALCLAVLTLFTKKQCIALMDGLCLKKTSSETVAILLRLLNNEKFREVLLDGICETIGEERADKRTALECFAINYYLACACMKKDEKELAEKRFKCIDAESVPSEYKYHYGILESVLFKGESKYLVGLEYREAAPYSEYKMSFVEIEKSPESINNFEGLVKQFRSEQTEDKEKCEIARKIFYGLLLCKKKFDKRKGYFAQDFFLNWTLAEMNCTPAKRFSYLYELLQMAPDLFDMRLRVGFSNELRKQEENLLKVDERRAYGKTSVLKKFYGDIRKKYLKLLENGMVGIDGDKICVWNLDEVEREYPWKVAQSLKWVSEHVLREGKTKKRYHTKEEYGNYVRFCTAYELLQNNTIDALKKRFEEESKEGVLVDKAVTEFGFYKECKKKVELYTRKAPLSARILNDAKDESPNVFYEIRRNTEVITDNLTLIFNVDGKKVPVEVDRNAFSGGEVFYGEFSLESRKDVTVEGIYYGTEPYAEGADYINLKDRLAIAGSVAKKPEKAEVTPCVQKILDGLKNGCHVIFDNRGNSNNFITELTEELKQGIEIKGEWFNKESEVNPNVIVSEHGNRKIVVLSKFSGKIDLSEENTDLYVIDHRSLPLDAKDLDALLKETLGFSIDNCELVTGERDLFSKYSSYSVDDKERRLTKEAKEYMKKTIFKLPHDKKTDKLERWFEQIHTSLVEAGRTYIYPSDAVKFLPMITEPDNVGVYVNGDWKPTQIGELKIKNEVKNEVYFYTQVINNLVQVNIENTFNFSITKEMEKWYDFSESGTVESEDAALKKYDEKLKERLKELQIKKEEFTNQMRVLRDNGQETAETYTELQEALKRIEKEEDEINGKLTNAETLENSFEEDLTRMFEERQKTEGREPLTDQEIWEFLGMDEASYEELKEVLNLSDIGQKDFNRKFVNAVYTQKEIAERPEIAGYDKDYSAAASGYGIIVEGMLKRLHKEIYDKRFCTTDSMYTNNYWRRWWSKSGELMLGSFIFHLDNSGTYSLNDITINKITDDRSVSWPNGGDVAAMRTAVQEEWWHSLDTKQNRSGSYQVIKNRLDGLSFSGAAPECQVSVTVNGTVKQRTTCNGCMHKNECQVHKAWKEHYETMKVVHSCRNDGSHDDDNVTDIVIVTPQRMEELVKALFRKSPKDGLFGYQRIRRLNQYANGNYGEGEQPVAVTKGMGLTETVLNNYKNTGTKVLFWCTVSAGPNNEKGEIRGKEGETSAHVTNVRVISKSASFTGNLVQWKHYAATIRNVNGTTVDVEVEGPATECVFTCTRRQQNGAKWDGTISWNGMELNAAAIAYASDAANGVMQEQNPENKSYKAELCGEERGKPVIKVKLLSEL